MLFHRAAAFRLNDQVYIRYHQAKDPNDIGRFFRQRLTPGAGWLDDLGQRRRNRSLGRSSPSMREASRPAVELDESPHRRTPVKPLDNVLYSR